MHGGCGGSHIALRCMISSESIISGALMNIMQFLTERNSKKRKWQQGPGMDLFGAVREQFGDLPIIAEDLGFLTDSVRRMLKESGYPGMKVLQFAFDSREESDYLPHNYERNCVVYTGTHDNNTVMGWYDELSPEDKSWQLTICIMHTHRKRDLLGLYRTCHAQCGRYVYHSGAGLSGAWQGSADQYTINTWW